MDVSQYPPTVPDEQYQELVNDIMDWQINHGSLLKLVRMEEEHTVPAKPIGTAAFPTPYPAALFNRALDLQKLLNKLYLSVAEDEDWLYQTTSDLIATDPLASALWKIYFTVKNEGYVQDRVLGIFRSDYMLQRARSGPEDLSIKQVEFNSFFVAGGAHADRIAGMHRHLTQKGNYDTFWAAGGCPIQVDRLPDNSTIASTTSGLINAHQAYENDSKQGPRPTAVLFVIQPANVNIADERPLEYSLWQASPPVPAYRVEYGEDVLSRCHLGPNRELLFQPFRYRVADKATSNDSCVEISVVYLRAGIDAEEYSEQGYQARLLLARSRAINCPSILAHIAGFKMVQHALGKPEALQHFGLSEPDMARIMDITMPMYLLDDSSEGRHGQQLAMDPRSAIDHVLKPSLEGGGHNIYGDDIPSYLDSIPHEKWGSYVLMERIDPPTLDNVLLSPLQQHAGPVISELGVFGVCMWRRRTDQDNSGCIETLTNVQSGWSFKTKAAHVDEMSVVKGFGCFDTPLLVDHLCDYAEDVSQDTAQQLGH